VCGGGSVAVVCGGGSVAVVCGGGSVAVVCGGGSVAQAVSAAAVCEGESTSSLPGSLTSNATDFGTLSIPAESSGFLRKGKFFHPFRESSFGYFVVQTVMKSLY